MIFLVLYDSRRQAQRVAVVNSREQASAFIAAGFTEVDRETYEQAASIAPLADASDLDNLSIARSLIDRVRSNPTQRTLAVQVDTQALDRLQARQRAKLEQVTQEYLNGERNLSQWFRGMVDGVNAGNIAASALAVGGLDKLTQADVQDIQRDNEVQAQYLTRFRRELESLSPAVAVNRSRLYAGATTARYWTAHSKQLGLPPLPAIPGVRTTCGSNCKCNWDIRQLPGVGNWDCVWRISAIESCPECLQRQTVFNPLQIRNGIIQPFNPGGIYG